MDTNETTTERPCAYDGCTSGLPGTVEVEVPAAYTGRPAYRCRTDKHALLCPACAAVVRDSISGTVTVHEDGAEPRAVAVKGVRSLFPAEAFIRPRKPRAAKPAAPEVERPAAAKAPAQAKAQTREEWLNAMVAKLRPVFAEHEATIPSKVRVTCGWPSTGALAQKTRRIGECWPESASADGTREILVSPVLADSVEVAAVLVHELVHAALPAGVGHGAPFARLAKSLGLTGKMTATVAGEALRARLAAMVEAPYPHAVLDMSKRRKQGTRMLKVECPDCGYTVRTTAKWIEVGMPACPCGAEMVLA